MKLILVRHGSTRDNEKNVIGGHRKTPLSRLGREQAAKAGKRLKAEKIDIIISSDLLRCRQTAEIIGRHTKSGIKYSKSLRERDWGKLAGRSLVEIEEMCRSLGVPRHELKVGGENYHDVTRRVKKFFLWLKRRYSGKNIVIVSHSGIIKCMIAFLLRKPVEELAGLSYKNTAITIIEAKGKRMPLAINSVEHLV